MIQESEEEEFARKKQEAAAKLAELAGVSENAAAALVEHGYLTVDGIGNASAEDLAAIAELTDEDRAAIAKAVAAAKAAAPAETQAGDKAEEAAAAQAPAENAAPESEQP